MIKSVMELDMMSGIPMVDIRLWNKHRSQYSNMLITIDTGASVTTLSKDILHLLGYEPSLKQRKRITTASGIEYVDEFMLERIKIGELEFTEVLVYGHTFPLESFSSGVIGMNVLSDLNIQFLFPSKQIVLEINDI